MRRPLFFAAAAFAAAILISSCFSRALALGVCAALALYAWRTQCKGWSGADVSHRRALILLVSFTISLANLAICDHRLAADPLLDVLEKPVTLIGIVKDASAGTNSNGKPQMKITVDVRVIEGHPVQPARILVTVPISEATSNNTTLSKCDSISRDNSSHDSLIHHSLTLYDVPPCSVIRFYGTPKQPEGKRNPNCFDYSFYLKTKGIQTIMRTEDLKVLAPGSLTLFSGIRTLDHPNLRGWLFLLREAYLERLRQNAGEDTAGLLRAVLFGDKGQLDEDVRETFQKNGTAHILAVSGLHVGMIYAAMNALWDLLSKCMPWLFGYRKGKRFFTCMAVFFTGYVVLSGYAPSVIRAVCMVLLHAFAGMTCRRYDLSSAAFAVGIAAMLRNPYILLQTGFQMSFLAILTLGLVAPYIRRVYSGLFVGSLAIQAGLGPYMLYQFNIISIISVFINVPVIVLSGVLVPAGMFGMLLLPGASPLQGFAAFWDWGLSSLCSVLVQMNELVCVDGLTAMNWASPPVGFIAAYYLGLMTFASEEGRLMILRCRRETLDHIHYRKLAAGLAILVLVSSAAFGAAVDDGYRKLDLVFVDVGQGDCMHLRSGGRNFLIDGGGSEDYEVGTKTLKPYLLKNGVSRIDAAFVTHLHTDHYRGICELAKAGMVRRIYVYEANRLKLDQICKETGLSKKEIVFLRQGQVVRLSKKNWMFPNVVGDTTSPAGDALEVLWPPGKSDAQYQQMIENEKDENAASLIMRVTLSGVSMIATGDLGEDGEQELMRTYEDNSLHADILKVGHHGSKTSSSEAFLDAVQPAFAVIQVGENNMYGHPTPETLRRLASRGIPVWRNDRHGAIGLKLRRGRVKYIKVMINSQQEQYQK